MLQRVRYGNELSRPEHHLSGAKLHPQSALEDQEQLVLVIVVVPNELTFNLDKLGLELVDIGDDPVLKVVVHLAELLLKINLTR
jgi:hypothetical protein